VIEIHELSKSYGRVQALQSVSLSVAPGEVFGLLGANGSGKTTLNRCLTTLVQPDSGTITINGSSLADDPEAARRCIGYLAEFPVLYPMLSAEEFLSFIAGLRGLDRDTAGKRIDRWLQLFELNAARGRRISSFSQGMRRKVALAAALIGEPQVVLLDEPTNGLDPPSVYLFRQVIADLRSRGRTVLLSSHVLPLVDQSCDRVGILAEGTLVAMGTIDELRAVAQQPDADLEALFMHFSGLDGVMLERLAEAGLRQAPAQRPQQPDRGGEE
jgi:ABC-2 type transport system ATP-binding protein